MGSQLVITIINHRRLDRTLTAMREERGHLHDPDEIGLSSIRLEKAYGLLTNAAESGKVMGGAVRISLKGEALETMTFGRRRLGDDAILVEPDTIFLTASVTKPVTSTAAMLLVERGDIRLDEPVSAIVPGFAGGARDKILVRHLLTHTSGLPDQLPENRELRSQHADLDEFIRRTYKTPTLFEAGTNISYQSAGMTMLMDIVQRVTGTKLAEFARREIFEPLGMDDTSYGVNQSKIERVSQVNVPRGSFQYGEAEASDWNWNSSYWWNLGSPWGGLQSTPKDLVKFLNMFLNHGRGSDRQILSPATTRAMTSNQTRSFIDVPHEVRRNNPWGLGWEMKAPFNSRFGDLCSSRTFGHAGATGTLVWADPESSLACGSLHESTLRRDLIPADKVFQRRGRLDGMPVRTLAACPREQVHDDAS